MKVGLLGLLVLPGTLATVMALGVGEPTSDWDMATTAGHYLLSGHLTVFADMPYVQMGPLALLAGGLPGRVYLVAVCSLLPLVLWTMTLPYRPTLELYVGAFVPGMLLAWPWAAFAVQGHGDDALVVVGVVAMVSALKRHREAWVVTAFLVAVAAKPTAILFLPLVFTHSRRAGTVALLGGGLLWAPFILSDVPGFLGAAQAQGELWEYSVPALLGGVPHTGIPGWVRPVQLVGGVALCWFLARRREPATLVGLNFDDTALATAVVGVFAFRVLLEPGTWNYYSTSVIAAAIMFDLYRGWRIPWVTFLAFASFAASTGEPLNAAQGMGRILALTGVLVLALAGGSSDGSGFVGHATAAIRNAPLTKK